jgi:glycosyltransferase involved in cell wall biosynthesis
LKIAFIANTSWNIYNFRKGLVFYFLERGDDVLALAPRDEYSEILMNWGVKYFETPLENTGTNPVKDLSYLKTLIRIFRAEKPHFALSYTIKSNIYASFAGKLTTVKILCNVSGLGTVFLTGTWSGKVAILLYRLAFRYANFVFFQNKDDRNLFLQNIPLDRRKIGLLPGSGINLDSFSFQHIKPQKPLKVLMIARVIEEKGVREFVEAASHFTEGEAQFKLVGKHDENHSRSI